MCRAFVSDRLRNELNRCLAGGVLKREKFTISKSLKKQQNWDGYLRHDQTSKLIKVSKINETGKQLNSLPITQWKHLFGILVSSGIKAEEFVGDFSIDSLIGLPSVNKRLSRCYFDPCTIQSRIPSIYYKHNSHTLALETDEQIPNLIAMPDNKTLCELITLASKHGCCKEAADVIRKLKFKNDERNDLKLISGFAEGLVVPQQHEYNWIRYKQISDALTCIKALSMPENLLKQHQNFLTYLLEELERLEDQKTKEPDLGDELITKIKSSKRETEYLSWWLEAKHFISIYIPFTRIYKRNNGSIYRPQKRIYHQEND